MKSSSSPSLASRLLPGAAVLAASLAAPALAGCAPKRVIPQETWLVVTSQAAPLLEELEDDDPPGDVARAGEMVKITKEMRSFRWEAKMDGKVESREGMAVEVKYAEEGAHKYGFKSDFGAEASVPTTAWLCEEIAGKVRFDKTLCPGLLRRARTADGSLLVYATCSSGTCPVGVLKEDKLSAITVENVTNGWFFQGKKRSLLVLSTRWTKESGQRSGGSLLPVVLENGAPTLKDEIPADTIDARDPQRMVARLAHPTVTSTEILLHGDETVKTSDGATLSTTPFDEKHPLPSLD